MFMSKKGQSTLEYAIIVVVIVAALIIMQVYIKRGVQGKLRDSSDDIGQQYSPGITTGSYTTTTGSTQQEVVTRAGVTTTTVSRGSQSRTGSETVADFSQEAWP